MRCEGSKLGIAYKFIVSPTAVSYPLQHFQIPAKDSADRAVPASVGLGVGSAASGVTVRISMADGAGEQAACRRISTDNIVKANLKTGEAEFAGIFLLLRQSFLKQIK
jgi:hypothetical protein